MVVTIYNGVVTLTPSISTNWITSNRSNILLQTFNKGVSHKCMLSDSTDMNISSHGYYEISNDMKVYLEALQSEMNDRYNAL